ncbi:MAG: hypothetical protein B6242_02695 [Anaerolineaceae bacterium 4572_78]|nr:MAG: hypothetical protein B6242_02695 [Anaerolineaceae bacterium 4572_78]
MKHAYLMSIFVFLIPLLAYSLTLAPDITWANYGMDGGDLIVASYMLGVPHPTGYPTYILLSRLFSEIPFGSIAWRYNLFSANGLSLDFQFYANYLAASNHYRSV